MDKQFKTRLNQELIKKIQEDTVDDELSCNCSLLFPNRPTRIFSTLFFSVNHSFTSFRYAEKYFKTVTIYIFCFSYPTPTRIAPIEMLNLKNSFVVTDRIASIIFWQGSVMKYQ